MTPPGWAVEHWRAWYRWHLSTEGDTCRRCGRFGHHVTVEGVSRGLRLGHLLAASRGGGADPPNRTITCGPCERAIGADDMRWQLPSLIADTEVWARCVNDVSMGGTSTRNRRRRRAGFDHWRSLWLLDTSRPAASTATRPTPDHPAAHLLAEIETHEHGGVL